VCIVLGSSAMVLSKITTDLVISPIENMIDKINKITINPLLAAEKEEEMLLLEELEQANNDSGLLKIDKKKKKKEIMETVILE
jgi:hypothetical protein